MTSVGETEWRDGTLWAHSPGCAARAWSRPADLAEARLATDPAVDSLNQEGLYMLYCICLTASRQ